MAIGSAPEIGTKFKTGLDGWLDGEAQEWRKQVGGDLLGGFATLHYPRRNTGEFDDPE